MLTVADVDAIAQFLGSITLGEPVRHGAVSAVPLLGPTAVEPDWLTLAEAGDRVAVTEIDEFGSVPTIKVANMADRPLLLLDGEELVGAKQNRILNTSVLAAAHAETRVPVSCVEQGRWSDRSSRFEPGDASLFASVRRKNAAWVTRSVRAGRGHISDQAGVWSELAARAAKHRVESTTHAMRDFFAVHERFVDDVRRALAARADQLGAIVYVSGRWAGVDMLAGPSLFARAWPRLCAGYAADALDRKPSTKLVPGPRAILERLRVCPVEAAPAVGRGREYRFSGLRTVGAALVADERVAHLVAFPSTSPVQGREQSEERGI